MPQTISGSLDASSLKLAIVVARFNEFITSRLAAGAIEALTRHGADAGRIVQVMVPGAWEIPLAARRLADTGKFDAIICLGCVMRGQTPHFDYVAGECAKGVANVAAVTGIAVSFGVITVDSLEQAIDRAGLKHGNKGADAALAAIEMANLLKHIEKLGK